MLEITNFDELNAIVGLNRSEDYDKYFEVMELSDSDKQKRIGLAEELGDNFLLVLAFLFTAQQYQNINWESIRERFENAYRNALKNFITIDDYLDMYIRQFSYDVTESTQNHVNDPYYYSIDRSRVMAENESNTSWNYSDYQSAIRAGYTRKKWIDIRDKRERETHRAVGGTVKPINEPFIVGSSFLQFAKDTSLGASSSEIVNCRCSTIYY